MQHQRSENPSNQFLCSKDCGSTLRSTLTTNGHLKIGEEIVQVRVEREAIAMINQRLISQGWSKSKAHQVDFDLMGDFNRWIFTSYD
jgi:hypothetical protein